MMHLTILTYPGLWLVNYHHLTKIMSCQHSQMYYNPALLDQSTVGHTIWYLGGGGRGGFLIGCNFFWPPWLVMNVRQFFWRTEVTYFIFAFSIMYVTICCFFWSIYYPSISTTNFFLPTFFVAYLVTIFLNIFFNLPPPPLIPSGASLTQ